MIDLIVAKLKTGPVANVIPYGSALPSPPYVVVKAENTPLGFVRYRVNAHYAQGQQTFMDTYVRKTVFDLLHNVLLTGTGGRQFLVRADPDQSIGQVVISNSDSTISQDRVFQAPEIQD